MKRRPVRFLPILILFLIILPFPVTATQEAPTLGADGAILSDFEELIPESIKDLLPPTLSSELEKGENADPSVIVSATDGRYLGNLLKRVSSEMLKPFLDALVGCLGMTVVAAILTAMQPVGGQCGEAMRFLISLCIVLSLGQIGLASMEMMRQALNSVSVFMRSLLPTVAILYAAGGNYTSGACEEGFILLLLECFETIASDALGPMLQVAFIFAVCAHVVGEGRLKGLCASVCRFLSLILTFLMTVLTAILGYQHSIAAGADGILLRTVKFAASGVIPVIGGAMSEAMGTAMGAVTFLRSTIGGISTIVVLLILLAPLTYLFSTRVALSLSTAVASALGCNAESGLFFEIGSIFDLAMAILAVCFLSLLFALTLMVRCASAIG